MFFRSCCTIFQPIYTFGRSVCVCCTRALCTYLVYIEWVEGVYCRRCRRRCRSWVYWNLGALNPSYSTTSSGGGGCSCGGVGGGRRGSRLISSAYIQQWSYLSQQPSSLDQANIEVVVVVVERQSQRVPSSQSSAREMLDWCRYYDFYGCRFLALALVNIRAIGAHHKIYQHRCSFCVI